MMRRVSDVMQRDLKTVRADCTLAEVISVLADEHVTWLPVVESNGAAVGVVTTSDLLGAEAEHSDRSERTMLFEQTLASDIMTPEPKTIAEEEGRLVGVVSQTDIVEALALGKL